MRKILNTIVNILLFLFGEEPKKPKGDLHRQPPKKKFKFNLNYTNIIVIIGFIIIFTIIVWIVFHFGALESTHVYNNFSSRI